MITFATRSLTDAVNIFLPLAFVVTALPSLLSCFLLCFLILLHLVLLHFEELARHAEGVFIALGADAEIPEFIDETRGIFVKETA